MANGNRASDRARSHPASARQEFAPTDCPRGPYRSTTLRSWRQYRYDFGYFPNVFAPTTFNEKVQARKLFERRPLFALWADKMAVRNWVAKIVGPGVLPKRIMSFESANTIPFDDLPNRYVLKTSHGGGGGGGGGDEIQAECQRWLSLNYADVNSERIYQGNQAEDHG